MLYYSIRGIKPCTRDIIVYMITFTYSFACNIPHTREYIT